MINIKNMRQMYNSFKNIKEKIFFPSNIFFYSMQLNLIKNNETNTFFSFSDVHIDICICVFANRRAIKVYILVKILKFKKLKKN